MTGVRSVIECALDAVRLMLCEISRHWMNGYRTIEQLSISLNFTVLNRRKEKSQQNRRSPSCASPLLRQPLHNRVLNQL